MNTDIEYFIPETANEVDNFINEIYYKNITFIALDTERISDSSLIYKSRVMLLQLAFFYVQSDGKKIAYIALIHFKKSKQDLFTTNLQTLITQKEITKVGIDIHNDIRFLYDTFHINNNSINSVIDLQDISSAMGYNRLSADILCNTFLKDQTNLFSISGSKLKPSSKTEIAWENEILEQDYIYAANDVLIILDIWNVLFGKFVPSLTYKAVSIEKKVSLSEKLKQIHFTTSTQNNDITDTDEHNVTVNNNTHKVNIDVFDANINKLSESDVRKVGKWLKQICAIQNITKVPSAVNMITNGYSEWATIHKSIRKSMSKIAVDELHKLAVINISTLSNTFEWVNK